MGSVASSLRAGARRVSARRKLATRQQVAAVCYRVRKRGLEFLLVQTSGGRWIFPKGGVEPGMTHAQSAALEAFEEAGVHGRMERMPFASFFHRRASGARVGPRPSHSDNAVTAHLCEVSRLEPPQESKRNPTWFSMEKAKLKLQEERPRELGAELARVVDRAASRIGRVHGKSESASTPTHPPGRLVPARQDSLREVRFEAAEIAGARGLAWLGANAHHIQRQIADLRSLHAQYARASNRIPRRLTSGSPSPEMLENVRFIDESGPVNAGKTPQAKSAKGR